MQLTQLAQYNASLGDASKAVPIIRQVLNQRLALTDWTLNFDPWWDKVRGKPEFEALFAEALLGAVKARVNELKLVAK